MPVLAPEGTAARPSVPSARITSTSTVGLPRLSRISRPRTAAIGAGCVLIVASQLLNTGKVMGEVSAWRGRRGGQTSRASWTGSAHHGRGRPGGTVLAAIETSYQFLGLGVKRGRWRMAGVRMREGKKRKTKKENENETEAQGCRSSSSRRA